MGSGFNLEEDDIIQFYISEKQKAPRQVNNQYRPFCVFFL